MTSEIAFAPAMGALKNVLKESWMAGDYDTFSRHLEGGALRFYRSLDVRPGCQFLDVACGSGQLALMAARDGAAVTGIDIATNLIERAQERAAAENLPARFEEGDAECLPFQDESFDVVASLIGAMFAPRPALVAEELTRVCRPGGIVAMGNWTSTGFMGRLFRTIARFVAPSGMPSPFQWGDEETVRRRFASRVLDMRFARGCYRFDYPFPAEDVVEWFRLFYGPVNHAFASLDAGKQRQLRREMVELWRSHNRGTDHVTVVDAEYLSVIAVAA